MLLESVRNRRPAKIKETEKIKVLREESDQISDDDRVEKLNRLSEGVQTCVEEIGRLKTLMDDSKRIELRSVKTADASMKYSDQVRKAEFVESKKGDAYWETMEFETGDRMIALWDTGASSNFMNTILANALIDRKLGRIVDLECPMHVEFGNQDKQYVTSECIVNVARFGDVAFTVVKNLVPGAILGRPAIRSHKQIFIDAVEKMDELVPGKRVNSKQCNRAEVTFPVKERVGGFLEEEPDGRLCISCPLLEKASIMPYRIKRRYRGETRRKIIDFLIKRWLSEGKCEEVSVEEVALVHEVVLVDKFGGTKLPEVWPLPTEQANRWRLTIDLIPLNSVRFDIETGTWILPEDYLKDKKPPVVMTRQHQTTAVQQWREIPIKDRCFYAKIDCRDAFSTISIKPDLRRLCGFWGPDGEMYRMTRLPQGWKYSPMYFSSSMRYVHDSVLPCLPSGTYMKFYQDDILIVACSEELCQKAMDIVIEKLRSFCFEVRPEKCSRPDSKTEFCGWLFDGSEYKPKPSRRSVNESVLEREFKAFEELLVPEKIVTTLRSWAGVFNYMLSWLSPELRESLNVIREFSIIGKHRVIGLDEKRTVEGHVKRLCSFYVNELPGMYVGDRDTPATLIVVDSNQNSWCALVLILIEADPEKDNVICGLSGTSWSQGLVSEMEVRGVIPKDKKHLLLPVKWLGGLFSVTHQKKLSSTWRERVGAILAVSEAEDSLFGQVYVICDNKNLEAHWHETDRYITAGHWPRYMTYCASVTGVIHRHRKAEAIRLVDELARILSCKMNKNGDGEILAVRKRSETSETSVHPMMTRSKKLKESPPEKEDSEVDSDVDLFQDVEFQEEDLEENVSEKDDESLEDFVPEEGITVPREDDNYLSEEDIKNAYTEGERRRFREVNGWLKNDIGMTMIPDNKLKELVEMYHRIGHGGINSTLSILISDGWHHDRMREMTRMVVQNCVQCAVSKSQTSAPEDGTIPRGSYVMETVGMDFMKAHNRFVMVVVDFCTGYIWANLIEHRTDKNVIKTLSGIFWEHRFPKMILSDNAPEFDSVRLKMWLGNYGVSLHHSPIYRPKANGIVERNIRTLKESIRAIKSGKSDILLEEAIHRALWRMNSEVRSGKLESPRDMLRLVIKHPFIRSVEDWKREFEFRGKFLDGEYALMKRMRIRDPLAPIFDIPVKVIRKEGNFRYWVMNLKSGNTQQTAEADLKKWPKDSGDADEFPRQDEFQLEPEKIMLPETESVSGSEASDL